MKPESFFSNAIPISALKKEITHWDLGNGTEVVIVFDGNRYHVFHDFCPHMGSSFAESKFCRKTGRLQCPWHGYFFNVTDGHFESNPNDDIFGKMKEQMRLTCQHYRPEKTPQYRLKRYGYEIRDNRLFVKKDTLKG